MSDIDQQLRRACLNIYTETRNFKPIAEKQLGYEILLSPPRKNPDYLFIGYQPGNSETSDEEIRRKGYDTSWGPSEDCQYHFEPWMLAKKLRAVFADQRDTLRQSVAMNALFVRAKSVRIYEQTYSQAIRQEIQTYCLAKVKAMIEMMEPQRIILIGFGTINAFPDQQNYTGHVVSPKGRCLAKSCKVFGREALAVMHLTGCRISATDRHTIANAILQYKQP